jgi:hypothetical protein
MNFRRQNTRTRKQPNPSLTGRYEYLMALQSRWPEFWRSLETEVLNRVDESVFDKEAWNAEFNRWASRWGVRDEWLLEAAWQTLCLWSKEHLRNRDPLRPWFFYGPEIDVPLFQLALEEAQPRVVPPAGVSFRIASAFRVQTGLAETIQQFAARMRRQFEQQLTDYCRSYEALFTPYKRKPSLAEHADWTALYQRAAKAPRTLKPLCAAGRVGNYLTLRFYRLFPISAGISASLFANLLGVVPPAAYRLEI